MALTPKQIKWLDKCTKGTWQLNSQTGLVDVDGDFDCDDQDRRDFKGVRFGVVRGDFWCSNNQLTSLEGAPQEVRGNFNCSDNQLTTLEGAPREVRGNFWCVHNQLTTLEGAPQVVGKDFYCNDNQLTTLEGAPQKVGGSFYCYDNQLTTLVGAPREVRGDFRCYNNQLISLEGAPQVVGGGFGCGNTPVSRETLKSIFGIMKTGKGYLESLEYLWTEIPLEDQALLYRPEFEWVVGDERRKLDAERRKLDALRAYQGFKFMI